MLKVVKVTKPMSGRLVEDMNNEDTNAITEQIKLTLQLVCPLGINTWHSSKM